METKKPINVSINLSKLDPSLFKEHKSGTFLNLVLMPSPNNKFGKDFIALQDLPKEAREEGKLRDIVGNATVASKKTDSTNTFKAPTAKLPWEN